MYWLLAEEGFVQAYFNIFVFGRKNKGYCTANWDVKNGTVCRFYNVL